MIFFHHHEGGGFERRVRLLAMRIEGFKQFHRLFLGKRRATIEAVLADMRLSWHLYGRLITKTTHSAGIISGFAGDLGNAFITH